MKQEHKNYIPAYRFAVRLGGNRYDKVCFSKISGIERTLEYEEIQEGGNNDGPHLLALPHKKHSPLILEKGAAPVNSWINIIKPGMWLGTWLEVVLLDNKGKETVRRFSIDDGLITKWEISGLDAMGNELLIEKLEIMHNGIYYSNQKRS
ncbi:MAG: phage tail protein [Lachnospiraceae bacterium]